MTDLNARNFVRRGRVLVPVDRAALEWLERIPEEHEVLITSRKVRSPRHHRWFFAMLRKVVEATELWMNEVRLLDDLKDAQGLYEIQQSAFGLPPRKVLKSISWVAMDQDEFRSFIERSIEMIATTTGIDPEDLMREVEAEEGPLYVERSEPAARADVGGDANRQANNRRPTEGSANRDHRR
jgi:hypothetical protein